MGLNKWPARIRLGNCGAAVAALALLASAAPAAESVASAEAGAGQFANAQLGPAFRMVLDRHNQLRARLGSPPLRWNPLLAAHAAAYAKTLTEIGRLQHSPRAGRERERENLVISQHGANSIERMLRTWFDEGRYYRAGIFPNVCTGDWEQCAHFTQMVWSTTTDIGCGFYAGPRYDALVCRYTPPGNIDGKPVVAQWSQPASSRSASR